MLSRIENQAATGTHRLAEGFAWAYTLQNTSGSRKERKEGTKNDKLILSLFLILLLAGVFNLAAAQAQQPQPQISHTFLKVGGRCARFHVAQRPGSDGAVERLPRQAERDIGVPRSSCSHWRLNERTSGIPVWYRFRQDRRPGYQHRRSSLERRIRRKNRSEVFRFLSDMRRQVSKEYGILNEQMQFASRTTFVVDKQGQIQHIRQDNGAIDIWTNLRQKESVSRNEEGIEADAWHGHRFERQIGRR
jgi:AhpC/TSA family